MKEQQEDTSEEISLHYAFQELLKLLVVVWPERSSVQIPVGDVWEYKGVGESEPGAGMVPFHKLTQWMAYSLVEAWQKTGIEVTDTDFLTALPEYRNGGLLLDLGVLKPNDPNFQEHVFDPGSPAVVELRAMTIAVIDELAIMINERLVGKGVHLSLAQILEGGTWAAGRKLAFARSSSGSPPIKYKADGTLF